MARQNKMIVVTGQKRIGKSHETLRYMLEKAYIHPNKQKGIIFDTNNEYGDYKIGNVTHNVKLLNPAHIKWFSAQTKPELRRIVALNKYGSPMNEAEVDALLVKLLKEFRRGILLVDDLSNIIGDALPKNFSSVLVNNAHRGCDLIIHLQSVGRILPKIRQNTEYVRVHKQLDAMEDSRHKLKGEYPIFRLAEILVEEQFEKGNTRFFVWVDRDFNKIRGNVSREMFSHAVKKYLESEYSKLINPLLKRRDLDGGVKFKTPGDAVNHEISRLTALYFEG